MITRASILSIAAIAAVVILAAVGTLDGDAAVAFIGGILLRSPVDDVRAGVSDA